MSASATIDPAVTEPSTPRASAVSLLARARSLRVQARHVNPIVAAAYRRRAAELSLEAWARAGRTGPVDTEDFTDLAA